MKKLFLVLLAVLGSSTAFADQCNYSNINGIEYKVSDKYAQYVKNDFHAYPDKDWYEQGTLGNYRSLVNNPFKVTSTDSVTYSSAHNKTFLSKHRFKDVSMDRKAYSTDSYYNIEVTTSDCQKFYFDPGFEDLKGLQYKFVRVDGKPITSKNYFDFLGDSVKRLDIKTTSEYDRFEKKFLVKTDYFKQYLIRGYFDQSKKKFDAIQLYLNTTAFTKEIGSNRERSWNNIRIAKDTDANSHEVIQISHNVNCPPKDRDTFGCTLKETIGIDVSEQFLRKHREGFELKMMGDHSFEREISADVVKSFLKEVDRLKKS